MSNNTETENSGNGHTFAKLMESLSSRLRACNGDPDTTIGAMLDELATVFMADQAYAFTKATNGQEQQVITRNMIPEEADTWLPPDEIGGPVFSRGDGSSLLVFPVAGGHLAFIRQPESLPFNITDGMNFSRALHAIEPTIDLLARQRDSQELYRCTIEALAAAIDAKDGYTLGHSRRVSQYATAIGRSCGLTEKECRELEISALMHDLGKIGTSELILGKPGKLTPGEFEHIKQHPDHTARILQPVNLPEHIVHGAVQHHERLDGSGYPFGLDSNKISLFGRIVAVADVFDALTSNRPYRPAMSLDMAIRVIHEGRGRHYDERVIMALVENLLEDRVFTPPTKKIRTGPQTISGPG